MRTKDVSDFIVEITGARYIKISCFSIEFKKGKKLTLYKEDIKPSRLIFDIKTAAVLQLHNAGIKQSQLDLNQLCTYSNPELFNSFRRDNTSFRQWS